MSPPLLEVGGQNQCNVSLMAASASAPHKAVGLKERNYFGFSDCSSVDSSSISAFPEENKNRLNLKATELRLGLPGSQSPEHDSDFTLVSSVKFDEKPLFPFLPYKEGICSVSRNKRGFFDSADAKCAAFVEGSWIFSGAGSDSVGKLGFTKEVPKESPECNNKMSDSSGNAAPAAKAQMVGWPPVRSFRKNTMGTTLKINDEVDGKPAPCAILVKVSMDGAPYLRKVDLKMYSTYQDLSSALEKMFCCFITGHGTPNKETESESGLKDFSGSEYVLTYEDKDGDWMLVGDVPWEMFIASCKRLKIMKGSDAIGLAPGAVEKTKNEK